MSLLTMHVYAFKSLKLSSEMHISLARLSPYTVTVYTAPPSLIMKFSRSLLVCCSSATR